MHDLLKSVCFFKLKVKNNSTLLVPHHKPKLRALKEQRKEPKRIKVKTSTVPPPLASRFFLNVKHKCIWQKLQIASIEEIHWEVVLFSETATDNTEELLMEWQRHGHLVACKAWPLVFVAWSNCWKYNWDLNHSAVVGKKCAPVPPVYLKCFPLRLRLPSSYPYISTYKMRNFETSLKARLLIFLFLTWLRKCWSTTKIYVWIFFPISIALTQENTHNY